MTQEDFNNLVQDTFDKCKEVLTTKGKVYGTSDRLSQLKLGGKLGDLSPELFSYTLVSKHFVALQGLLQRQRSIPLAKFDDYLLDIINYMVLIRALLREVR
jgi:hypothetical protein